MSFLFHKLFSVIKENDNIKKRDVIIWSVIINKRDYVKILLEEDNNHNNGTCICKYVYILSILTVQTKGTIR